MKLIFTFILLTLSLIDCQQQFIIDSDIGQDMDDSWALALALKRTSDFKISLFLTAAHNTEGRAQIVAKYLDEVQRTEIPIGIGLRQDNLVGALYGWAKNYNLSSYPGQIFKDGVAAAADLIRSRPNEICYLALAPFVNFQSLVSRFPDVIPKIKAVYAMGGSIDRCYDNRPGFCPEYNIAEDIGASQVFFNQSWPLTLTPLDTSGLPTLDPSRYRTLLRSNNTENKILNVLLENYCYWARHGGYQTNCDQHSTTLYDPTAVIMSFNQTFFNMKKLRINVTDQGDTIQTEDGKLTNVALTWNSGGLLGVEEYMASILLGE